MAVVQDGVGIIQQGEAELILTLPDAMETVTVPLEGESGIIVRINEAVYPIYDGPVTITPSDTAQIIETDHTSVLSNITVGPIPDNYGLITWNGSVLTVS